jgi:hypothetical protein
MEVNMACATALVECNPVEKILQNYMEGNIAFPSALVECNTIEKILQACSYCDVPHYFSEITDKQYLNLLDCLYEPNDVNSCENCLLSLYHGSQDDEINKFIMYIKKISEENFINVTSKEFFNLMEFKLYLMENGSPKVGFILTLWNLIRYVIKILDCIGNISEFIRSEHAADFNLSNILKIHENHFQVWNKYLCDALCDLVKHGCYLELWYLFALVGMPNMQKLFHPKYNVSEQYSLFKTVIKSTMKSRNRGLGCYKDQLLINMFMFHIIIPHKTNDVNSWLGNSIAACIRQDKLAYLDLTVNQIKLMLHRNEIDINIMKIFSDTVVKIERGKDRIELLLNHYIVAKKRNNVKIFETLLKIPGFSETLDISNEHGVTTTQYACDLGHYNVADFLIDNGGSIVKLFTNAIIKCITGSNLSSDCENYLMLKASKICENINNFNTKTADILNVVRAYFRTKFISNSNIEKNKYNYNFNDDIVNYLDIHSVQHFFENLKLNLHIKPPDKKMRLLFLKLNNFSYGNGVTRHIFERISDFYVNKSGLFTTLSDNAKDIYLPYYEEEPSDEIYCAYRNFGIFLGLCFLFASVDMRLSINMFKQSFNLVNRIILPDHLSKIISKMHNYTEQDFIHVDLNMTIRAMNSEKVWKEYQLIPDGYKIAVTKKNWCSYAEALKKFYCGGYRMEILEEIHQGFHWLFGYDIWINPILSYLLINQPSKRETCQVWIQYSKINFARLLDHKHFEQTLDAAKSRNHIRSNNYELKNYPRCRVPDAIRWFFEIIDTLDDTDYDNLIRFMTGSKILQPGGIIAMNTNETPIKIKYNNICDDPKNPMLPTSQTCFNTIVLPWYQSKEIMLRCLLIAIRECNEMTFV